MGVHPYIILRRTKTTAGDPLESGHASVEESTGGGGGPLSHPKRGGSSRAEKRSFHDEKRCEHDDIWMPSESDIWMPSESHQKVIRKSSESALVL